jgi:hypothetical protein
MPTRAEELNRVEQAILEVLRETASPMSPYALVDALKKLGWEEGIIRAAMWYLIDREEIDLTIDRQLRSAA